MLLRPPPLLPFTALRLLSHPLKYARLILRLLMDRRVPLRLKALLVGAVAYVLSPIDVAPEILIPLLGVADDIAILLLAVHTLLTRAPRQVVEEHALAIAGIGAGDREKDNSEVGGRGSGTLTPDP
jgi:uncharacterized membrane protein YkvA (DUF1232 family)